MRMFLKSSENNGRSGGSKPAQIEPVPSLLRAACGMEFLTMKQAPSLAPAAVPPVIRERKAFAMRIRNSTVWLWAQKDTRDMTGQFFCQLYDTESECDGLVSYDRAVWKVDTDIRSKAAIGKLKPADLEAKH